MFDNVRNLALLMGFGTLVAAAAARAGDAGVAQGRQIALQVCAACHVVAATQQFSPLLNPPATPFVDVAKRPNSTRVSLQHFVATTHWDEKTLPLTMPNPSLTNAQVADVVSYILSLRNP